jgi:hypothetical protein
MSQELKDRFQGSKEKKNDVRTANIIAARGRPFFFDYMRFVASDLRVFCVSRCTLNTADAAHALSKR